MYKGIEIKTEGNKIMNGIENIENMESVNIEEDIGDIGVNVVDGNIFNFRIFLIKMTGDDSWEESDGYDTGVGLDYYYENDDGQVAYINVDQDYMTLNIDGDERYSGGVDVAIEKL